MCRKGSCTLPLDCIAATMNGSLCWQICHRCSAHGKCHIVSTAFALVGTFQLWTALPSLFANPMFLALFSGGGGQSSPLGWPCTRVEGSPGTFFTRSYWVVWSRSSRCILYAPAGEWKEVLSFSPLPDRYIHLLVPFSACFAYAPEKWCTWHQCWPDLHCAPDGTN